MSLAVKRNQSAVAYSVVKLRCETKISRAAIRPEAVNARRNTRTALHSTTTTSPITVAEQVNPNRYSLSEVEAALKHVNPECRRDEWYPVGMAIADAFGESGRELFLSWSRGDLAERT